MRHHCGREYALSVTLPGMQLQITRVHNEHIDNSPLKIMHRIGSLLKHGSPLELYSGYLVAICPIVLEKYCGPKRVF